MMKQEYTFLLDNSTRHLSEKNDEVERVMEKRTSSLLQN